VPARSRQGNKDASLRLDERRSPLLTIRCETCAATATYTVDDLISVFGRDANVTQLPAELLPCPSKRDRGDGAFRPRAFASGNASNVRRVHRP